MRRYAGEPTQLVGAESEDVVQAGVGAAQVERVIQLALAAQHAGRQLVRQAAVALGETREMAVARIGQGRAGSDRAQDLQSRSPRGSCFFNPASPGWGKTA